MVINGQTNYDNANSYLVNAYSHVKDAYDSNNISHLKYYANRSLESFKLSKENLKYCDCKKVLKLTDKGIDLLVKVEAIKTFEDGRFFVKRARDISKKSVIEVDKCAMITNNKPEQNLISLKPGNEVLSDLRNEQLKLQQQQETLKLKEQLIKTKLAEQQQQELILKKEKLILSYKGAIAANIETYNKALNVCNCNHGIINSTNTAGDISTKSIDDIRSYYKNNLKELASNYLLELNSCK